MRNALRLAGIVVAVFVVAVAAAQVVRTESSNRLTDSTHAIQALPATSGALTAVLNRSCGDCHSNTMVSRSYTRIPPFSTLMARGAREGRKAVDFSKWTSYSSAQQRAFLLASCTDAKFGKMPVKGYVRFRPEAQLSTQDVETICSAAELVEQRRAASAAPQTRRGP